MSSLNVHPNIAGSQWYLAAKRRAYVAAPHVLAPLFTDPTRSVIGARRELAIALRWCMEQPHWETFPSLLVPSADLGGVCPQDEWEQVQEHMRELACDTHLLLAACEIDRFRSKIAARPFVMVNAAFEQERHTPLGALLIAGEPAKKIVDRVEARIELPAKTFAPTEGVLGEGVYEVSLLCTLLTQAANRTRALRSRLAAEYGT